MRILQESMKPVTNNFDKQNNPVNDTLYTSVNPIKAIKDQVSLHNSPTIHSLIENLWWSIIETSLRSCYKSQLQ